MELFYKGYRFTVESTDIIGGVSITHMDQFRIVARVGCWEGRSFTDLIQVSDEIKELIDSGNFKSIEQIPIYK